MVWRKTSSLSCGQSNKKLLLDVITCPKLSKKRTSLMTPTELNFWFLTPERP